MHVVRSDVSGARRTRQGALRVSERRTEKRLTVYVVGDSTQGREALERFFLDQLRREHPDVCWQLDRPQSRLTPEPRLGQHGTGAANEECD